MVNDTISDLLTRIRNANLRHDTVDILNTKNELSY
jgi:ribosomal protein S8